MSTNAIDLGPRFKSFYQLYLKQELDRTVSYVSSADIGNFGLEGTPESRAYARALARVRPSPSWDQSIAAFRHGLALRKYAEAIGVGQQ